MATDQKTKDKAVIMALLDRFNKSRSAYVNVFIDKVNKGEVLGDYEQTVIDRIMGDRGKLYSIVQRNPEYQELYDEAVNVMNEIIEKNEENKKKQNKFSSS